MKVKLLLFGEMVQIPKIAIGLGVGAISVWMDGSGFTTASNNLGTLGYILLETPNVDIGDLDADKQRIFSNLHGQIVTFDIAPSLFVKDGGNARIGMTVSVQSAGSLVDQKIEFLADDCTGVAVVADPLHFSATMLQMANQVADLDTGAIVGTDDVVAIADAAPNADAQASATA
jgi:hypothetical protein